MLIQITNKCSEGCPHCFINATPNGETMDINLFRYSIAFAHLLGVDTILISGGEITEIPDFDRYLRVCLDTIDEYYSGDNPQVLLLSNGTFLLDPDKSDKMRSLIKDYPFISEIQVSSAKEYYRSYERVRIATVLNPVRRVSFCDISGKIRIKRLGRAKNLPIKSVGNPNCSNLLSRLRYTDKFRDFKEVIDSMQTANRVCTPSIYIDGEIRVGETPHCQSIGNVRDVYDPDFFKNIYSKGCKLRFCNKCDSRDNVDRELLDKLGL